MSAVPADSSISISSHVIYKAKFEDGSALTLKVPIAPHGNDNSIRHELWSSSSMCWPVGMRTVVSIASLLRWSLNTMDVQSAFHETCQAARDVYIDPPRESLDRGRSMWRFLTAAYGLLNAHFKWQTQTHELLCKLGFTPTPLKPPMFLLQEEVRVVAILEKIVDDLLL